MKLVYRLVFAELIGPFIFGVLAFTSVMFAGTYMLRITGWIMSGDMPIMTALQMGLLLLPAVIPYTLPMSTLLAVLLGIGRLSGDSEVVALFAGGISLYRIAIPVLVLGALVSAGSITLNETLVPWAHDRYETTLAVVLKQITPAQQAFSVDDDNLNLHIVVKGGMDADKGILRNVTIIQFALKPTMVNDIRVARNQPVWEMYADRAVWQGLQDKSKRYRWNLYDGAYQLMWTNSPVTGTFSKTDSREQDLGKTPSDFALFQKSKMNNTDQLSFRELTRMVGYLKKHPDRPREKITELDVSRWNKLALPISSLVFALLAAPMGIRPSRSTSSVGFGLSVGLIMLYWIIWNFTSHMATQGSLPPVWGAFAADGIGVIAAVALMRRAAK